MHTSPRRLRRRCTLVLAAISALTVGGLVAPVGLAGPTPLEPAGRTRRGGATDPGAAPMARRNVYQWPFDRTSIWNTPIGSGASYVPAGLASATAWKGQVTADPEQIGVDPQAPGYPEKTLTSGDRVGGGEVRVPPDLSLIQI